MIDGHVHIYSRLLDDGFDARAEVLLSYMEREGVEKAVIAHADSNEYLSGVVRKHPDKLAGLAAVEVRQTYAGMHRPCKQLEQAVKQGLSGLKIHPSNMGVRPDDLSWVPLFRKAADLKIPVMIHSNPWGPGFYEVSSPQYIDHVARIFPDLRIVIAHLGGTRFLDTVKIMLPNIWAETSGGLEEIAQIFGTKTAERVLRKIGFDHAIYGTDFPMPNQQLGLIQRMHLKKQEEEQLLHNNAQKVFFSK